MMFTAQERTTERWVKARAYIWRQLEAQGIISSKWFPNPSWEKDINLYNELEITSGFLHYRNKVQVKTKSKTDVKINLIKMHISRKLSSSKKTMEPVLKYILSLCNNFIHRNDPTGIFINSFLKVCNIKEVKLYAHESEVTSMKCHRVNTPSNLHSHYKTYTVSQEATACPTLVTTPLFHLKSNHSNARLQVNILML